MRLITHNFKGTQERQKPQEGIAKLCWAGGEYLLGFPFPPREGLYEVCRDDRRHVEVRDRHFGRAAANTRADRATNEQSGATVVVLVTQDEGRTILADFLALGRFEVEPYHISAAWNIADALHL